MRSIAVMGEKGGTAKSTTAINVAAALARRGDKVLVIDADGQANTTMVFLGGREAARPTLADVLMGEAEAADAIRPTGTRRLQLLPAAGDLADVNVALAAEIGRERRLRLAMEGQGDAYDYVVVDTGPARSIVNVNVMNFAGEVLAPVEPGIFALAGLGKVQDAIAEVARYLDNRALRLGGLLLARCRNDNVSRDVERQLREMFGPLVYEATVPASVKVEEANARFLPVIDFAPRSPAAAAYLALTEEIADGQRTQGRARDAAGGPAPADDTAAA
jgi:chromosome partitioning protein